jgi:hypothetical protein
LLVGFGNSFVGVGHFGLDTLEHPTDNLAGSGIGLDHHLESVGLPRRSGDMVDGSEVEFVGVGQTEVQGERYPGGIQGEVSWRAEWGSILV